MIAFAWADLNPIPIRAGVATIYTETLGSAPNRRFVLEYRDVINTTSGDTITTQMILYENTHDIEFHITKIKNGVFFYDSGDRK